MTEKCPICNWLEKYGFDFIKNYKEVNSKTIAKFLNVDIKNFKNDENYKILRHKLKQMK